LSEQFAAQAEALANQPAPEGQAPAGDGELADALSQAAEAAADLEAAGEAPPAESPGDLNSAAESSQQAAESLAAAAQQAAEAANSPPGSPAPGETASQSPSETPGKKPSQQEGTGTGEEGRVGGTLDDKTKMILKKYGFSVADWTRLPGRLQNQIVQAESKEASEEYRELVRRYFRALARRTDSSSKKDK